MGLDRWRGGGQDDRNIAQAGTHDGHVAALIEDAVFLLEAGVVLLVDDDQAEIAEGQEQRRTRADDDARFAGRRRLPDASAIDRRDGRMPFHRLDAEALLEALDELAGQGDLGQQDHDLHVRIAFQRARDRFEIDLGLAGPGDAVQQRDGKYAAVDRRLQAMHGLRLLVVEFDLHVGGIGHWQALLRQLDLHQRAGHDQSIDDGRRGVGLGRELLL